MIVVLEAVNPPIKYTAMLSQKISTTLCFLIKFNEKLFTKDRLEILSMSCIYIEQVPSPDCS